MPEEHPQHHKRQQVQQIEIPGSRPDHDDPEDRNAKGDEELLGKEGCLCLVEFRFEEGRVGACMVPLPGEEDSEGEVVDLEEDAGRRDLAGHVGKAAGEGHEDNDHQREEVEVEEPEIECLHAVEHLEVEEPEHGKDDECTDKIDNRGDGRDEVPGKGQVIGDRPCHGCRDVPDHQGHRECVNAVGDPFEVHLADRVHAWLSPCTGGLVVRGLKTLDISQRLYIPHPNQRVTTSS